MNAHERDHFHKRWTLNTLIQGAASHIHVTAPHMVRESLDALIPGLTRQYIQFVLMGQLNYVCGDLMLMQGRPNHWFGFSSKPQKVIADHPVFAQHGNRLARAEAKTLRSKARAHRVRMIPMITPMFMMRKINRLTETEAPFREPLQKLAIQIATEIYDIAPDQLDATLTKEVAFGNIAPADNFITEVIGQSVIGYGGVNRDQEGKWKVVARAWIFPLLVHELIEGITELICMHGMSDWDEATYRNVTTAADRLDHETMCIQVGPELWRRLLGVVPRRVPLAKVVMQIAKLPPDPLHELINQVIADPELARVRLVELTR
ncbi:hypothetical protein Pla22_29480 [Rubripirellula amarantea]|uniref:Uncharacterized protein n=1 Tax=Rubripirellula amarantea TaxID=2527999 RepID=A0A5C5WI24_9BACT|nr:hypothetical protein [Rubripirellula amarantea]TWT50207.1 hypothetical protein Pla22_29480 [Rubripirellula amarantea]